MMKRNLLLFSLLAVILAAGIFVFQDKIRQELAEQFFSKASGYFELGSYDMDKAQKWYKMAAILDPELEAVHYQLARVHFLKRERAEGLKEIDKELASNPQNLRAYYVRGLLNGFDGNFGEAIEDFKKFVAWAPKEWAGYNDLAWAQNKAEKFQESKLTLLAALVDFPDNPWLLNNLGAAFLGLKEHKEAGKILAQAKDAAQKLTIEDWRKAYPGNEPDKAEKNLENFKKDIDYNIMLASQKLARAGISVSACESITYSACAGRSCSEYTVECHPELGDCPVSSCSSACDCGNVYTDINVCDVGGACVSQSCNVCTGSCVSSCTSSSNCPHHNVCNSLHVCESVPGAGTGNECATNDECREPTHTVCNNCTCQSVVGPGINTCVTNSDCCPVHNVCNGCVCESVAGVGANACLNSNDCSCPTPTHKECVSCACASVSGAGGDSCSNDSQCGCDYEVYVNLGASPSSGNAPLRNVILSDSAVTNFYLPGDYYTHYFYCNRVDSNFYSPTAIIGLHNEQPSFIAYNAPRQYTTAAGLCDSVYANPGNYRAYVIVDAGGRAYGWASASVSVTNALPYGWLDITRCPSFSSGGWVCDPTNFYQPLTVALYDGPYAAGKTPFQVVTANNSRPDVSAAGFCGGNPNTGFAFLYPESFVDGTQHCVYAYAIDIPTGDKVLIGGSPKCATCTDNASCVSIDAPNNVAPGQIFSGSITMKNTGDRSWYSDATPHRLGSYDPAVGHDMSTWGINRINLLFSPVNIGQPAIFTYNFTAPGSSGNYTFGWQMVEDAVGWIPSVLPPAGAACTKSISVGVPTLSATLTAVPNSGPAPLTTALNANVGGSASGSINYSFWWNCSNTTNNFVVAESVCGDLPAPISGTCDSNSNGIKCDGVSDNPKSISHIYSAAGNYKAKVIVERGYAASVQAQADVEARPVLTVSKAGTGSGSLSSSPVGINCPGPCSSDAKDFNLEQRVSLFQSASPGSVWGGWSGDPDCSDGSVVMNESKTCFGTFNPITFSLNVLKSGTGTGIVTSRDAKINCGSDCNEVYNSGDTTQLDATADPGSTFVGWFGTGISCSGVGVCPVTMDAARTVTARFSAPVIWEETVPQ